MPFVISRVSVEVSREQELELKRRLGEAIALVPGKSEAYLLVELEDRCHLFLAGSDEAAIAYLDVSIFGNEDHAGFDHFAAAATQAYHDVLGIDPSRIYLRFSDIASWSVAGRFIDRRMFA